MMIKIYICKGCGSIYDLAIGAQDCCKNYEVDLDWMCGNCWFSGKTKVETEEHVKTCTKKRRN